MFFHQAFKKDVQSSLPPEVIFTIEHLVSQTLAKADLGFLQEVLQHGRLAETLFEELDFYGQVPKTYLQTAKEYLKNQEPSLKKAAESLVKDTGDEDLREKMCKPSSFPTT